MRVRVVLAFCVLGAGACAAETEPGLPPVTPEASYPLFASPGPQAPVAGPADQSTDRKARLVLQRILRGAAAGETAVCGWVVPAHARKRFGKPCVRWVAGLSPGDRARLKKVKVPTAAAGADGGEWIVEPADLVWPAGEPGGLRRAPYVMRLKGERWMLAG
ncbi:hypothetical protein ABGB12_24855 [Actinocorallia sp. B10E7]|uniref:hypothetical protein n=1 Tax=Actinocorallia sp. B10E7 TaxID=3153558 RepID=UPI00325C3A43